MKTIKYLTLFSIILISSSINAKAPHYTYETEATDSRIEYTGRILKKNNSVSFDWSGVYTRVKFKGSSISIKCSDTKGDWFNYWIDKEMHENEDGKFYVNSLDTLITLTVPNHNKIHEIIIQKRTEGEQGCLQFTAYLRNTHYFKPREEKIDT